jgi:hypothetical protein
MKRLIPAAAIIVIALATALTAWLLLKDSGKDEAFARPSDVPQCGLAWRPVDAAKPSPIYNELHGVAVLSPDNAWAVGTLGEESAALTLIEHWDGTSWSHVDSPNVPGFSNHLYAVAALSPTDIWAAGAHHNGTDVWQTTAMHWDGTSWRIVPTPSIGPISSLNALAAISPNDVWAAGESSTGSKGQGTQALLMHWDGSAWTLEQSLPRQQNSTLTALAALSPNDIWAAGSYTDKSGTVQTPLFLHWDGSAWNEVDAGGNGTIWGLSALSPNDVWAVGSYGPQSVAMHWDGKSWQRIPTPNVGTGNNALNSVAALSTNDVWAVGSGYLDNADVAASMHWDGKEWKTAPAVTLGRNSDVLW